MKNLDLDLGHDPEKIYAKELEPATEQEHPKCYPHFHYTGMEELPIADKGTMTIEYEIVREEEEKVKDRTRYSCTVDIKKIIAADVEVEAPTTQDTATADALDKLAEALSKREEGEEDEDEGEEDEEDEGEE